MRRAAMARSWRATLTPFSYPTPFQAAKPPKNSSQPSKNSSQPSKNFFRSRRLVSGSSRMGLEDAKQGAGVPGRVWCWVPKEAKGPKKGLQGGGTGFNRRSTGPAWAPEPRWGAPPENASDPGRYGLYEKGRIEPWGSATRPPEWRMEAKVHYRAPLLK